MARPARLRTLVRTALAGGLVAVLTPIWLADRAVSRVRTARRAGASRSIERIALGRPERLAEVMGEGRPVIITDLYDRLDLQVQPDFEGLRTVAPDVEFPVNRHRDDAPYFLYVGDYGAVRERIDHTTVEPFLDELLAGGPESVCTYKLFAIDGLDGGIGRIIDEMAQQLETWSGRRPDARASGIWIGSAGVTTPLHHDAWTGLLFQPAGSKRVVMYGPEDRDNIYFTSPFEPKGRWSDLPPRSREADPETFPRLDHAVRHEGQLEAGETLFIPPYWAHEVEALEPNISIPFRFATRRRDHLNPGFLRPAVEILHRQVATATR